MLAFLSACTSSGTIVPVPLEISTAELSTPGTGDQAAGPFEPSITPRISPTDSQHACPPGSEALTLRETDFKSYPETIRDFLNRGGSIPTLDRALYQAGVANQPQAVSEADLDRDGSQDIVVSIFDPESLQLPPAGTLLIYACKSGEYQQTFQLDSGEQQSAPGIRYLQDINRDGAADLVTSLVTCGAHTCFETIQVIVWHNGEYENRLEGSSIDLPYPDIQISDDDADGFFSIVVVSGGIASIGAGLQRSVTRIWLYDPASGSWKPGEDIFSTTNYRLHVLQDADAALERGELESALVTYQWVASDHPPLDDWIDPANEQAHLRPYAGYKAMVVSLALAQNSGAQAILEGLGKDYPSGVEGRAFVEMSQVYWDAFQSRGPAAACDAVKVYAITHRGDILDPLGSKVFGYANPDVHPEDMCP